MKFISNLLCNFNYLQGLIMKNERLTDLIIYLTKNTVLRDFIKPARNALDYVRNSNAGS